MSAIHPLDANNAILTPAEARRFEQNMRRIREGRPAKRFVNQIDQYDVRESVADALKGRAKDPWRWTAVLEYFEFKWFPKDEMTRVFGPQQIVTDSGDQIWRMHAEGQWRRHKPPAHAFTVNDLVLNFNDSPEDFDLWMRQQVLVHKAKSRGIKLIDAKR